MLQIPKALRNVTDGEGLAMFWRGYGRQNFREISEVARGVLGAPATSAVLERDFDDARNLTSSRQCDSLGSAYVEMTMFLHAAYDFIPTSIPRLSSEDVEGGIPIRLRDPTRRNEVAGLTGNPANGQGGVDVFFPFGDIDNDREDGEKAEDNGSEKWRSGGRNRL